MMRSPRSEGPRASSEPLDSNVYNTSQTSLAMNVNLAYGSTVRPLVLSVTVTLLNSTVIGGVQSGVNDAVSVTL
jgi:hypothetical protein